MSRRHKDISRAHALLEGEGWHITGRATTTKSYSNGNKRRDKRRCKHYDKLSGKCEGKYNCKSSSGCGRYSERKKKNSK